MASSFWEPVHYESDLFGNPIEVPTRNKLSEDFMLTPFSVLNAREGWWQARKAWWIALGIKSEIGRVSTGTTSRRSDTPAYNEIRSAEARRQALVCPGGGPMPLDRKKVSPGGSPRPACDYSNNERGDGSGRPLSDVDPKAYNTGFGASPENNWKQNDDKGSGTSIFDPTLTELSYRWFCPLGGQIVDPFAGGSVRGIIANWLDMKYWGCDLREDQVIANEQQLEEIVWGNPRVEPHGRLRVVRDDVVPGGTKERALMRVLPTLAGDSFCYATPAEGFAQIALARCARRLGKTAHIFVAERKERHPRTLAAASYGAIVHEVKPGYLAVVQARAREFCESDSVSLLPFGLDCDPMLNAVADVARETGENPTEVWSVAGSGVLTRGLQRAWPDAKFFAVAVGKEPRAGDAELIRSPYGFGDDAGVVAPFPSCQNYDAKGWEIAADQATDGALFWNVAADVPSCQWAVGDSAETLNSAPKADFIFSCPPYGDLERYSNDPRDLSNMEYPAFVKSMRAIVAKCYERLREDRFACFIVGEFRDKKGNYRNFVGDTISAFMDAGFHYYNEGILVTAIGSLPIRVGAQFSKSRKLGKTHQNMLVFVKGDAKRATKNITKHEEQSNDD